MTSSKRGEAWVYKDNVDTDVIIPARYLKATSSSQAKTSAAEVQENMLRYPSKKAGYQLLLQKALLESSSETQST